MELLMPCGAEVDARMKAKWSVGVRREERTQFPQHNGAGLNASTASTGNKTRLREMTATTTGRWGKLRFFILRGLLVAENKYIPLEMRWKMAWGKRNE